MSSMYARRWLKKSLTALMRVASSLPASAAIICCKAFALAIPVGPYFWADFRIRSVSTACTEKATSASVPNRHSSTARTQPAARARHAAAASASAGSARGQAVPGKTVQESRSTGIYRRPCCVLERAAVEAVADMSGTAAQSRRRGATDPRRNRGFPSKQCTSERCKAFCKRTPLGIIETTHNMSSGTSRFPMKKTLIRLSLLTFASCAAMAQTSSPVAQSVQKAIEGNPEVAAKFNAFRASNDEIDVAAGDWKPHLDASGSAGKRNYENTQSVPRDPRFYEGGVRLELSQLLWDGLATHHEV